MSLLAEWIKGILFPRRCMLCREFLQENETDLCHTCRTDTEEYPFSASNPPPKGKNTLHFLDSFTAVWYYEGNVRKSILRFKFGRAVHLAPKFGRVLAMKILTQGPEHYDVLTWVPVSRLRRFQRGYDQCELLARTVGEELGCTPVPVLRKIRHTRPQSSLTRHEQRKANVLGAFAVAPDAQIRGKVILLLDDIYTTGATTEECARVLLTAGAKEVHCAAVAAAHSRKK